MKGVLIFLSVVIAIASANLYDQLKDLNGRLKRSPDQLETILVAKAKQAASEGLTMTKLEMPWASGEAISAFIGRMREKHPGIVFRTDNLWVSKVVEMHWK